MSNSHDKERDAALPAAQSKKSWEQPSLRNAGHLGEVLQDKGIVSEDDPGDAHYKTPGHDMT
jgi:hypothetical protein